MILRTDLQWTLLFLLMYSLPLHAKNLGGLEKGKNSLLKYLYYLINTHFFTQCFKLWWSTHDVITLQFLRHLWPITSIPRRRRCICDDDPSKRSNCSSLKWMYICLSPVTYCREGRGHRSKESTLICFLKCNGRSHSSWAFAIGLIWHVIAAAAIGSNASTLLENGWNSALLWCCLSTS